MDTGDSSSDGDRIVKAVSAAIVSSQEFTFVWFVCECMLAFAIVHCTTSLFSFLPASCTVGQASREIVAESDSQKLKVNTKCVLRPASRQRCSTIYLPTFKEVKIQCHFACLLSWLQPLEVLVNYAIYSMSLLYWIREAFLK